MNEADRKLLLQMHEANFKRLNEIEGRALACELLMLSILDKQPERHAIVREFSERIAGIAGTSIDMSHARQLARILSKDDPAPHG